ncbi:MAG: class I SAM-dependent methyltransferase [Betaproteobacteria bacterium]|nr:class I SAM-dependent methyltransferase [Betaproteobacteria bacterium]
MLAATLALGAGVAPAQTPAQTYRPEIGQPGKDVVWVPTPERLIQRMLQMADASSKDVVVDLGSGDGRIPIAAAKLFGARGIGIEFDAELVQYSIRAAAREGLSDRVRFAREDFFQTDLSGATIVTLYVSPTVMRQLRPRLLALKPGTRIVSHQFTLEEWEPDEMARVESVPAYLWVVPASAAGKWRLTLGTDAYELVLSQEYQMLRGSARSGAGVSPIVGGRLRGETIRFSFADKNGDVRTFSGRISGDRMEGSARLFGQADRLWSARRQ